MSISITTYDIHEEKRVHWRERSSKNIKELLFPVGYSATDDRELAMIRRLSQDACAISERTI